MSQIALVDDFTNMRYHSFETGVRHSDYKLKAKSSFWGETIPLPRIVYLIVDFGLILLDKINKLSKVFLKYRCSSVGIFM